MHIFCQDIHLLIPPNYILPLPYTQVIAQLDSIRSSMPS